MLHTKHAGNCSAELSVADTTRQGDRACASRCVCMHTVCMHTVCTEFCATPAFRRIQASPCEICAGQSGTVTGVPKSTSIFHCQYHFAICCVSAASSHVSVLTVPNVTVHRAVPPAKCCHSNRA